MGLCERLEGKGAGKDFHILVLKIGGTPLYFQRSFLNLLFPSSRWEKTGENKIKKTYWLLPLRRVMRKKLVSEITRQALQNFTYLGTDRMLL